MSDAQDRIVAIKAVQDCVQEIVPELSAGEIELAVDRSKLASTWTTNTAYKTGDVIVPAMKNGHVYQCIYPGTSQAEPHSYDQWLTTRGVILVEGTNSPALQWEEAGSDLFNPCIAGAERNVYDIYGAAKKLWGIRMAQTAQWLQDGDVSFQQAYEHCKEMFNMFRPFSRQIQVVRC